MLAKKTMPLCRYIASKVITMFIKEFKKFKKATFRKSCVAVKTARNGKQRALTTIPIPTKMVALNIVGSKCLK